LIVYVDSSQLIPLYAVDRHSDKARRRMEVLPEVLVTPLNRSKLAHAFLLQVFRRHITAAHAKLAWQQFNDDCRQGLWTSADLPSRAWNVCADLALRFSPTLGTRTLDSLHVACALELRAERFWTFDERQARLADSVGLNTTGRFNATRCLGGEGSIPCPSISLRGDDAADGVAARKHDAAVINFLRRSSWTLARRTLGGWTLAGWAFPGWIRPGWT
jgi:predicted nucleic acid-binding protein